MKQTLEVLNKIVEKDGDCLNFELCGRCPFRTVCLNQFLATAGGPSRVERREMALSMIARIQLMGDVEVC